MNYSPAPSPLSPSASATGRRTRRRNRPTHHRGRGLPAEPGEHPSPQPPPPDRGRGLPRRSRGGQRRCPLTLCGGKEAGWDRDQPPAHAARPSPSKGWGTGGGGAIARYARGRDYHDVLKPRLWALVRFLEERLGRSVAARVFVDSGPCSERAVAQRAGLGFFGKNTNLLTCPPARGCCWGAALTDVALPADPPLAADCGTCTPASTPARPGRSPAPAGRRPPLHQLPDHRASRAPYRDDAARRGRLAVRLRRVPGGLPLEPLRRSYAGAGLFAPTAAPGPRSTQPPCWRWTRRRTRKWLRGSPLKRAKRQGLRRNAALVLGTGTLPRRRARSPPPAMILTR